MHEREPRRLKETAGTPDALNQALTALRKGPNDAARLARVGKRLESIEAGLDAPRAPAPAAVENLSWPSVARPALPMLKLVLGGALMLAPLLWFAYARFAHPANEPVALPAPAQQAPVPAPHSEPASVRLPTEPTPQAALDATPAPQSASRPNPRSHHAALGKPSRSRGRAALSELRTATETQPSAAEAERAQAARAEAEPAHEAEPARTQPAVASQAQRPEPAAQAQRPQPEAASKALREPAAASRAPAHIPSESELLFGARKALPGDAELALRLLTEHATRYPKGQLVPEREVLAIEALRSLGRTQEAETRLQRFQARYPNSLHLQRLQR